jgi:predicted ArsR family transcriptional regulator
MDDHRQRILSELRGAPAGLDVRELAGRLGIHPNTVRWHLGALADSVSSEAVPNGARGRPRIVYRLRADAIEATPDEYRLLATILSGALAAEADGSEVAERTGRAWGRYLVGRPAPNERVDAVERVAALLGEQGFAPETGPGEIRMRRCPFHDLAETQPEIVCAVHKGLIEGALQELGSDLAVDELDVFVEPDLCVTRLTRRPSAPSSRAACACPA